MFASVCLTVLLTATCADDVLLLEIPSFPEPLSVRVRAWGWLPGFWGMGLLWEAVRTDCVAGATCVYPVGCSPGAWFEVRAEGLGLEPGPWSYFYWSEGGGRFIDAANVMNPLPPLCR